MDPESSTLPADLGMDYQYQVIAKTAARLSQSQHVNDFVIYSNKKEAEPLDDLILKIRFREHKHPFVYMCQIKHKTDKNIDISDNPARSDVSRYLQIHRNVAESKDKFTFLSDEPKIPDDNIRFWLYCNKNIENVSMYKGTTFLFQCDFNEVVYADRIINPFETVEGCCYKLSLPSIQTYRNISLISSEEYENFFSKLYLILNQSGTNEIDEDIKKYCELTESRTVIRYIREYFNNDVLSHGGLSKETFQTELLKIRLSDYNPPFTRTIDIGHEEANNFIELVNENNLTLISKMENIENYLYSCFLRRINQVLRKDFAWGDILSKDGQFITGAVTEEFKKYAETKASRQWLIEPKTINSLLLELWAYGELPLILKTDSELMTILSKYQHLKKKFVVICDVERKIQELSPIFATNIFTNMADIKNTSLRNGFLESVKISLQGKEPVSLADIVSSDECTLKELNCSDVLRLIKKRKAYLRETCFTKTDSIVFVIEDENYQNEFNINQILPKNNENIKICCASIKENSTFIEEHIRNNSNFENYSICYLRLFQGKLEFIGGDVTKLRNYFIDENGDGVYVDDTNHGEILPIIGQQLSRQQSVYLPRCLSEGDTLNYSLQNKSVFFLSGDVISFRTEENSLKLNEIIDQNADEDILINIGTDSIEKYWSEYSACQRPLFHVTTVDGCRVILDHRNTNLSNSSRNKSIYFISDNCDKMKKEENIFKLDEEIELQPDKNILINIGGDSIEEYWTKFSASKRPLFHVKVIDGRLKILEHRNCNLNSNFQNKSIYFLSGDIASLQISVDVFKKNEEIDLKAYQNILINIKSDSIEKYWSKFSDSQRPLFHVKISDGGLKILDHRNSNPETDILCEKVIYKEEDFFKITDDSKVTIVVGDQGAGKSTFLYSLSISSNKTTYILYCNLARFERELKDRNKRLLESPLKYIFDTFERSCFKKLLLNSDSSVHKTKERLIIFMDSLDEILPLCEDAILFLIRGIVECNVRVIIASRFLAHDFLISNLSLNNIHVKTLKICDLREEDFKNYFQRKGGDDIDIAAVEKDFLLSPAHLSYLFAFHQAHPTGLQQSNKFDICKMIILKTIEDYYRKVNLEYSEEIEAQNEDVLNSHRLMAMVAYFGKDFVIRHCSVKEPSYNKLVRTFKQLHIKLGIVRYFKDDRPVFVNSVFVQFLVMEWFNKRRVKFNAELQKARNDFFKKYNCPSAACN